MWIPWRKIARRNSSIPISICATPSFSLKDILGDEDLAVPPNPQSTVFRRSLSAAAALRSCRRQPAPPPSLPAGDDDDNRIVLYHTTLRVVRRTYEDCRTVRNILRSFRVAVDERDLSMDARYLSELDGVLGERKKVTLPLVFLGRRRIFGVDEIWSLHESGELKKIVEGLPPSVRLGMCHCCGGKQFVLCRNCNGSHKCSDGEAGGFKICTACNENGLVRCADCSPPINVDIVTACNENGVARCVDCFPPIDVNM